ncbi:MAG: NHLP family bacteriocin export ABC transporter peptidase/permease/ATPase subunit [Ardenticatenaceae bacterium]|nr:NHLP family bacteriocin export ABC transporter peptidase/permease/ATPase subunit [Ardenticatenaceae bacterium]
MAISLKKFGWNKKAKEGIRAKTPTVLQMEAVECGAASLSAVLGYYGTYIPLEELRVACGVSRDGSKASNILHAARRYGLEAKGFRLEPSSLYTLQMPVIVHWNFNHFLVVEGFKGDTVYLNDPASGPRTVSLDEFDESFTGIVLTFNKGENYKPQGKKPNTLKILRQRLTGSEIAVAFVVLASLALVIPGLLLPAFTRVFVDYYLVNGRHEWIVPLLGGMVLTAIARSFLTWLQQYYLLRLETKLSLLSASQFFWHILQLPVEFFTQRSAGDINSRIGQNDRVAQLLSGELATSLMNVILIFFYAILMFRYSVPLTILGICFAALNFVMLQRVSRFRKDINLRLIKDQGKLSAATFSSLQQIETLKSTGAEGDAFSSWAGYQANANNAQQQFGSTNQILTVLPGMLAQLSNILVLALGSWLVIRGQMTVGTLVAFQTLMASFLAPVNQMVQVGGQVQEVNGTIQRLDDVLKYETDPQVEFTSESEETAVSYTKLSGRLQIRNLTFGYSKLAAPLIEDFDLDIEPGMRVALVGGSGSGKSTIARLIAGLYQPWEGQILLDGVERHLVPRAILNNSLRIVDQQIFMFEGSIHDNLAMWDQHIPMEQIIQAAKDAHIHLEIAGRPGGYDSEVQENGRNFSGGQRQRLEIARALVTNPSVLILDEATSALDPVTEQIIDDHLRRRGCTCLIVAHRLSTIRDCDEIIVLDSGKVLERGSHDALWRKNGVYTRLIKSEGSKSEILLDSLMEQLTA